MFCRDATCWRAATDDFVAPGRCVVAAVLVVGVFAETTAGLVAGLVTGFRAVAAACLAGALLTVTFLGAVDCAIPFETIDMPTANASNAVTYFAAAMYASLRCKGVLQKCHAFLTVNMLSANPFLVHQYERSFSTKLLTGIALLPRSAKFQAFESTSCHPRR